MVGLGAALIGGGLSIAGGIFGAGAAGKRARDAAKDRRRLNNKLNTLENSRQEIINPYKDLSSMISNPFSNLSVATGAAEIQIEQADIALANTLDTLRSTGASAGGATALAQAALKSKKGVAAGIEQQEKNNEDKRAAGEKQKQDALMREGQRVQQGEAWEFAQREQRQMQELDRTAALLGAARQAEAQAASDQTGAITGAIGAVGNIAGSYYGAK
jgi:hypothetical protein|tara:strand:+ start:532 stop:1179 length:648 start_codon:yes stop_codon:yes gene_type:complete